MPIRRLSAATPHAARHEPEVLEELPLVAERRRSRLLRGGPRAPLPLVPIIAICAGVAVAYVSQTARATQATYQATTLESEQEALEHLDQRLGDDLARLRSTERIVAAAQQIGMRPAGQWSSLAGSDVPVVPPPAQLVAAPPPGDGTLERLVAALSGTFGTPGGGSAGP